MPKQMNEYYKLEGINFSLIGESISDDDLTKINKFAVKPVSNAEVVVYSALLINDEITRNYTLYTKEFQAMILSLPNGEGNFIGASLLLGKDEDHQQVASAQIGRIFDAYQVIDKEKHFGVMAKIYILKDGNEEIISKVDAGILKELSISTQVEFPMCSICNQKIYDCDHIPGENGCHVIMTGKGFCAEVSLVAVPGSDKARILNASDTKDFLKLENLRDAVMPMITSSMDEIRSMISAYSEKFDTMNHVIEEMGTRINLTPSGLLPSGVLAEENFTEEAQDIISYPADIVGAINDIVSKSETLAAFVIKYASKYDLEIPVLNISGAPEILQGMKGVNAYMILDSILLNLEAIERTMVELEEKFGITDVKTILAFGGLKTDIPEFTKYLISKINNIIARMYIIEGKIEKENTDTDLMIKEVTRYGLLSGRIKFEKKNFMANFFSTFPKEELQRIKEAFVKEVQSKYTNEEKAVSRETISREAVKSSDLKEIAKQILNGGKTNV